MFFLNMLLSSIPADRAPCHGDTSVVNLQESWWLVQRGAPATGRPGPYCWQRWVLDTNGSKPCCTVHMCIPMQRFCLSRFVIATCRVCCIATVKECVDNLSQEDDKENLVASLWGAERCLRVLESVSTVLSSWILSCTKVTLEWASRTTVIEY